MPERSGVQVVNINVDLMYVYTCSFLHSEADLMGNAVYGSSDVGTVGHFDMQVYDKTAVLVSTQTNLPAVRAETAERKVLTLLTSATPKQSETACLTSSVR